VFTRLAFIPFLVSFEGREDTGLGARLEAELPGIAAWAFEGCRDWQANGLYVADKVKQAGADYRKREDVVKAFVEDQLDTSDPKATAPIANLYRAYTHWAEGEGISLKLTKRKLVDRLTKLGYPRSDGDTSVRSIKGLLIKPGHGQPEVVVANGKAKVKS
jgi:putative DNA primase/helicase